MSKRFPGAIQSPPPAPRNEVGIDSRRRQGLRLAPLD